MKSPLLTPIPPYDNIASFKLQLITIYFPIFFSYLLINLKDFYFQLFPCFIKLKEETTEAPKSNSYHTEVWQFIFQIRKAILKEAQ